MFPDLARDDVFRLETARLWLRWPRASDAAAIHRFCCLWEVARFTARIPHPYPPGSAERFIYAAREANASGRDLTLVMTPIEGQARRHRFDQPRVARRRPPDARVRPGAGSLGQGPGDRGGARDGQGGVWADLRGRDPGERPRSRTPPPAASWRSAASRSSSTGPIGAPARGGLVECHSFRLTRQAWAEAGVLRRQQLVADRGVVQTSRGP